MARKDMARSTWTRVQSKKQIIRDFACGERAGKTSLLKILEIKSKLKRSYEGREIILADTGYYWLQLAIDKAHVWFTAMFDDRNDLVQIYVDVTDGNDVLSDNPSFEDMYLDYVIYGTQVYELDRNELDEAFFSGLISKEQYETALSEGKKIYADLTENTEQIKAFFSERFAELKAELDSM